MTWYLSVGEFSWCRYIWKFWCFLLFIWLMHSARKACAIRAHHPIRSSNGRNIVFMLIHYSFSSFQCEYIELRIYFWLNKNKYFRMHAWCASVREIVCYVKHTNPVLAFAADATRQNMIGVFDSVSHERLNQIWLNSWITFGSHGIYFEISFKCRM